MVCKKCNHENPDSMSYCENCGNRLKDGKQRLLGRVLLTVLGIVVSLVVTVFLATTISTRYYARVEDTPPPEMAGEDEDPVYATDPGWFSELPIGVYAGEAGETELLTEPERLPNVPEEWWFHKLLLGRATGPCEVFRDEVVVTVFFVEEPESHWPEEDLARNHAALEEAAQVMEQEAARQGVFLDLRLVYHVVTAMTAYTDAEWASTWADKVLTAAGMPELENINFAIEEAYGVEAAPVVFFLNRPGRTYASICNIPDGYEYMILFGNAAGFRQGLCRLFGLRPDFYPGEVVEQAKMMFPNSLMTDSGAAGVDSLTAYIIGWTDELSADAMTFLEATASLDWSIILDVEEELYYTGYVEKETDSGTYAGGMLDGLYQGQGTMTWSDGGIYEGRWEGGRQNGKGTMTWPDGRVYEGEWADDRQNGHGTMAWPDGTTYEGRWENGQPQGTGTMAWPDGTVYIGHWVNGGRQGRGMMVWTNGAQYYGEWLNGNRHGEGTMVYPSGFVLTGIWADNVFLGWI